MSVAPERIPFGDRSRARAPTPPSLLETDLMGEIGVFERGATVDQTAYALLSDLLEIVRLSPRRTPADGSRGFCRRAGGFLVARRDEAPRNDKALRRRSSE